MMSYPEFYTAEEWEKAPVYWGPGNTELHEVVGSIILDLDRLTMIAETQEQRGDFTARDGSARYAAPIKIGDTKATFLKVVSESTDDFIAHTPLGPEVLVVINGMLTVKNSRFQVAWQPSLANSIGLLQSGDVVSLEPESVLLNAHGFDNYADGLALSIQGVHKTQRGLIVVQNQVKNAEKVIDPDYWKPRMPYKPKDD